MQLKIKCATISLMIIDSHCHLYDEKLKDIKQDILLNTLKNNQICVCNADSVKTSCLCVELANKNKNIYATVGVHPHEANTFDNNTIDKLTKLKQENKKVVAIGEIGLDYYYNFSPRETQIEVLKKQIVLADKLSLPCVFHVREATEDFLNIVKEMAQYFNCSGVIHSFSGSWETAQILLNAGFYLGFNGIITFNNANKMLDIVKKVPLNKMLIETDSPYLTPVPFRGTPNRPEYVKLVAEKIASLKNIPVEEVINATTQNAINLFKLEVN